MSQVLIDPQDSRNGLLVGACPFNDDMMMGLRDLGTVLRLRVVEDQVFCFDSSDPFVPYPACFAVFRALSFIER